MDNFFSTNHMKTTGKWEFKIFPQLPKYKFICTWSRRKYLFYQLCVFFLTLLVLERIRFFKKSVTKKRNKYLSNICITNMMSVLKRISIRILKKVEFPEGIQSPSLVWKRANNCKNCLLEAFLLHLIHQS